MHAFFGDVVERILLNKFYEVINLKVQLSLNKIFKPGYLEAQKNQTAFYCHRIFIVLVILDLTERCISLEEKHTAPLKFVCKLCKSSIASDIYLSESRLCEVFHTDTFFFCIGRGFSSLTFMQYVTQF